MRYLFSFFLFFSIRCVCMRENVCVSAHACMGPLSTKHLSSLYGTLSHQGQIFLKKPVTAAATEIHTLDIRVFAKAVTCCLISFPFRGACFMAAVQDEITALPATVAWYSVGTGRGTNLSTLNLVNYLNLCAVWLHTAKDPHKHLKETHRNRACPDGSQTAHRK